MNVIIEPSVARGKITPPPSKSYAHRLLICAALGNGTSEIRGISKSEDMLATLDCLSTLGAKYEKQADTVSVTGIGNSVNTDEVKRFYCRESGSTLRFMIPLALLFGGTSEFYGTERLISRGVEVYRKIFEPLGISFEFGNTCIKTNGKLNGGIFKVDASISSQFVSGLLFALPMAEDDSTLELVPPIESKSYIDITLDTLSRFGIVTEVSGNIINIPGGQKYLSKDLTVEGDYSNAAFLDALNCIGGDVTLDGLYPLSLQGDKIYAEYFKKLCEDTPTLDLANCPDLGPILFTLAAMHNGALFTGTRRLKIKESDRATAMARELVKFGADILVEENNVIITKSQLHKPSKNLSSHNDHRVAMSLAVIMSRFGGTLEGAEAVKKSYPNFFEDIIKLGINVKYQEETQQ